MLSSAWDTVCVRVCPWHLKKAHAEIALSSSSLSTGLWSKLDTNKISRCDGWLSLSGDPSGEAWRRRQVPEVAFALEKVGLSLGANTSLVITQWLFEHWQLQFPRCLPSPSSRHQEHATSLSRGSWKETVRIIWRGKDSSTNLPEGTEVEMGMHTQCLQKSKSTSLLQRWGRDERVQMSTSKLRMGSCMSKWMGKCGSFTPS